MIISFLLFLIAFTLIGVLSVLKSKGTKPDYYIASGSVKPWLVGLSAVATNNSGFMFIGNIGYTYKTGLASIWLMVGWVAGDFLASLFVHKPLKEATERTGEITYAGVLSNWNQENNYILQKIIGIVSLIFLLVYASAQLVAGGKALLSLLEWPMWVGILMGAMLVVFYCFSGGIRASIWTDAAQSIVMIISMGLLCFVALSAAGGFGSAVDQMGAVDGFLNWFPKDLAVPGIMGGILFAFSWSFAGLSVIGQPHIMVRFMALDDSSKMMWARFWYYVWFLAFYALSIGVGLLARIHLPELLLQDAEHALPMLSEKLLNPIFVGLMLAGIFAATMSTADSLILSCSASISHDIFPKRIIKSSMIKATTVVVTVVALGLALINNDSVFSVVIMAWSGMASAFAPLLIFLCFGVRVGQVASIAAILVGFGTAFFWWYKDLSSYLYEGLPGILSGVLVLGVYVLIKKLKKTLLVSKD